MRWCLMLFICIINVHAAQKHSLVACSISYMWAREGNLFYFARISLPLRPAHISSFIDDAVGYSFVFISCALMGLAADKWHKCKSIKLHQLFTFCWVYDLWYTRTKVPTYYGTFWIFSGANQNALAKNTLEFTLGIGKEGWRVKTPLLNFRK